MGKSAENLSSMATKHPDNCANFVPAFAPTFQETVLTSLERLTSELQHLREDVTELKQHGETRDELMRKIQSDIQTRDHDRQSDIAAVDVKTAALSRDVAVVQTRLQALEEKSAAKMESLEKTAGHRIAVLEQKSSILKGGYVATLVFASVVAFLCEMLYHALDLGKFLLRK
jgi:hypothetical protein